MAEKKKTQKKSTATKKEKTTKKSTSKKVKLTYQPIGFNSTAFFSPLRKKDEKGRNHPLIEGLPMDFVVEQGEVIEVTQKQFEELKDEGCVESDEEYESRKKFIANMSDQYPKTFSDVEIALANGDLISAVESQKMIYNDKLIRCD